MTGLALESWTRWLPQGLSRPVILWVPSVASLQKLKVNETQQVSAFSGAPTVSEEAVTAAAQQHLFQQKTSLKGESGQRAQGCCLFLQISLGLGTGTLGDKRPQDTLPSHQYISFVSGTNKGWLVSWWEGLATRALKKG